MPAPRVKPDSDDTAALPAHVAPISLPLVLKDLRSVNVYAILGRDGVTLIDAGWADLDSESVMVDALNRLGFAPSDVVRILVTHSHWDHYSRAISWQRRYGTPVLIGREEGHTIGAPSEGENLYSAQVGLLLEAGAPDLADLISKMELEPYERDVPFGPPDAWVDDGDEIDCGGIIITARSTPGHTRGHMVYEDRQSGLTFSGDHILPRITPSLAMERRPEKLPLRSYLASLRLFLDVPDSTLLPAHGLVTPSVHTRAQELIEHHRKRLDQIMDRVQAGSSTSYEVAQQMLWTRQEFAIGELGPVHRMAAILEVMAHLELLATRGALRRKPSPTTTHYEVP